jgi:hypothetical protein
MSNIIKPAKCLKTNTYRKSLLQQTVTAFLYHINSAIDNASKENKNKAGITLPTDFNLPESIDYDAFKVETYYMIITELINKGYKVAIKSDRFLIISWDIERATDISHMVEALRNISA